MLCLSLISYFIKFCSDIYNIVFKISVANKIILSLSYFIVFCDSLESIDAGTIPPESTRYVKVISEPILLISVSLSNATRKSTIERFQRTKTKYNL